MRAKTLILLPLVVLLCSTVICQISIDVPVGDCQDINILQHEGQLKSSGKTLNEIILGKPGTLETHLKSVHVGIKMNSQVCERMFITSRTKLYTLIQIYHKEISIESYKVICIKKGQGDQVTIDVVSDSALVAKVSKPHNSLMLSNS